MRKLLVLFSLFYPLLLVPEASAWFGPWRIEDMELVSPTTKVCFVCPSYWIQVASNNPGGVGTPWIRYSSDGSSTWSGWEGLGSSIWGDPSVISEGPGNFHIFVRGTDNKLYHKIYDGAFHDWESLGGIIYSSPFSFSRAVGHISVCAMGPGDKVWCRHGISRPIWLPGP